jgi:hypothetical protein
MHCAKCGQLKINRASYCSACGAAFPRLDAGNNRHLNGTPKRYDAPDRKGASNVVIGLSILAVVLSLFVLMAILASDNSEAAGSAVASSATATPVKLEIDASTLLLAQRELTDAVLGKPKRGEVPDCDKGETGFSYPDGSYLCATRNGVVTYLHYKLKSAAGTSEQALAAVGLQTENAPLSFPAFSRWSSELGNGVELADGKIIRNLLVFPATNEATGHAIEMDMHGWEKAQRDNALSQPPPANAEVTCRVAIENAAWSQSSVDFGWFQQPRISGIDVGKWLLQFDVTAKNAFGAEIDSIVTCTVRCGESDCVALKVEAVRGREIGGG